MIKVSRVYYVLSLFCFLLSFGVGVTIQQNHVRQIKPWSVASNPAPSVTLTVIGAKWCGPCQRMAPHLAALKEKGYSIEHRDVDRHNGPIPELTYYQFGEQVRRVVGYQTEGEIKAAFDEIEGSVF